MDLRHPAHYTLSWIVYINNHCKIYKTVKVKNSRFLEKINWRGKKKYWNAKFIYSWHLTTKQILGELTIKPKRFLIKACLRG